MRWEGSKMAKCLVFFIMLAGVLVFITGCPQAKPEPVEPAKVETPKAETLEVKPPKVEPPKPEQPKVEQPEAETTKAESPKPETPKPEPEPPQVEPKKAETAKVETHEPESPKAETTPKVSFNDKYAVLLNDFVDDKGMVNYKTLKRKKTQLKQLLDELHDLDPHKYNSWSKEDKIALWINAYNIQMLKIIIGNYPIKSSRILRLFWPPNSIRHIRGIWDEYKFIVMDEEFTLAEIQQRFFREKFDEPRVFLAISQVSLSSPPLHNEPYYGHKLYKQLDDQTKRFLSCRDGLRIDTQQQVVYLSAIFQPTWFGKEFISKYGTDKKFKDQQPAVRAVLNFITNYISERDVHFLEIENYSVKYIAYDWRLNEQ